MFRRVERRAGPQYRLAHLLVGVIGAGVFPGRGVCGQVLSGRAMSTPQPASDIFPAAGISFLSSPTPSLLLHLPRWPGSSE